MKIIRSIWLLIVLACIQATILITSTIITGSDVKMTIFSILALISTLLNVKKHYLALFTSSVQSVFYLLIALPQKFYGDCILNGGLAIFYGITFTLALIKIKDGKKQEKKVKLERPLKFFEYLILIGIGVVITLGYGFILSLIGTNAPYLNALSTFLVASYAYLVSRQDISLWVSGLAQCALGVYMWVFATNVAFSDIATMFFHYTFSIIINVIGLIQFIDDRRLLRKEREQQNNL